MKITNKQHLPEAIVWAVTHDRYDGGHGDISITTLIAPAQIRKLREMYQDELVEDATDRIWSMLGSAIHYVIENAAETMKKEGIWDDDDCIIEKRFYHDFNGVKISGQIDLYERGTLTDFKLTSVYAIKSAIYTDEKKEWDAQINLQRWLLEHNGIEVPRQYIVAIARDWTRSFSLRDRDYPPRACMIEIPRWSEEQIESYVQSRLNAHFSEYTQLCTPEECWETPTKYALMKVGRKSAVRVMDTEDFIWGYAIENDLADLRIPESATKGSEIEAKYELKKGYSIETRPGERKRCQDYCDVAPFCDQYKQWQEENAANRPG